MRTTLSINETLLKEAKELSGARTKAEAIDKALQEFVNRRKTKRLLALEGKIDLSFSLEDLLDKREKDVPY